MDEPDAKPEAPCEMRAWEVARAFDKSTKCFGQNYIRSFINDTFHTLFETDTAEACKCCERFIEKRNAEVGNHVGQILLTVAQQECDGITTFFTGYLGAMGDEVFNDISFENYHSLFADSMSVLALVLKQLVGATRKSKVFLAREKELARVGPTELKYHAHIEAAWKVIGPGNFTDNELCDVVALFCECIGKVRETASTRMLGAVTPLLVDRCQELLHPSDNTPAQQKAPLLRKFSDLLKLLPQGADSDAKAVIEITRLKTRLSRMVESYSGDIAGEQINAELHSADNTFIKGGEFGATLKQVKDTKSISVALHWIGVRLVESMAEGIAKINVTTDAEECVLRSLENFEMVCKRLKVIHEDHKCTFETVDKLVRRAVKVLLTGHKYNEGGNMHRDFASFNKALIEFSALRHCVPDDSHNSLRTLAHQIVIAHNSVKNVYNAEVVKICDAARTALVRKVQSAMKLASGGPNGQPWWIKVKPTWTHQQVLALAQEPKTGLLMADAELSEAIKNGSRSMLLDHE
jgi:hypothetical protein